MNFATAIGNKSRQIRALIVVGTHVLMNSYLSRRESQALGTVQEFAGEKSRG
jgi:hypothetical protein